MNGADRLLHRCVGARQRRFLYRWLLVGRLAFGQMGSPVAETDLPRTAWVQLMPEPEGTWHPLETVNDHTVLTLDHEPGREPAAWPHCCPN